MEHANTTARVASGRPRCCACIAVRAGGPGWNDRYDNRYGQRREYARADRRRTSHRLESVAGRPCYDRCVGTLHLPVARARHIRDLGRARRIRDQRAHRHLGLRRSEPIAADSPAKKHQRNRPRKLEIFVESGAFGNRNRCLFGQSRADRGGRAARRRRRSQQRLLRDRRDARRLRSAEPGRRQSERLHSRRLLRPDRLRIRRRADQSLVRQLPRKLRKHAWAARAPDLHRRRRGGRERDGTGRLRQSGHQDGNLPRLRRRQPGSRYADVLSRRARRSRGLDARPALLVLRRNQRYESGFSLLRSIQRREPCRHDSVRLLPVVHHDVPALFSRGVSEL